MANQEGREAAVGLTIQPDLLRPLVESIVREVVVQLERDREVTASRIAYSEEEAARLLGLRVHVLRDERLRGRIAASAIVGNRTRYLRADLLGYMASRRKTVAAGSESVRAKAAGRKAGPAPAVAA